MKCLTKIVATVGPVSEDKGTLARLIKAGVSVFRLNLKHNDISWHKDVVSKIRNVARKLDANVAVMIDLQGPELRLSTDEGKDLEINKGEEICLADVFLKNRKCISLTKSEAIRQIKTGQKLYIDNGLYEFKVIFSKKGLVVLKSYQDCVVKNGKSVAIPGFENNLPALTREDFSYLSNFSKTQVDYVCLSFCRSAEDVKKLRQVLKIKKMKAGIVCKIESGMGLDNLNEIINEGDVVMIARGDLGVEVPMKEVGFWQKEIIKKCRYYNKPVIVATQMMESMIERSRPTRAEVSDVTNAVFDGADALMLSGETAVGKYPVRVVDNMVSICKFIESKRKIDKIRKDKNQVDKLVVDSVRNLVVNSSDVRVDKILVFSKSGKTARLVSSYRLGLPIVGVTDSQLVSNRLLISYGLVPYFKEFGKGRFDPNDKVIDELVKAGLLSKGEMVIVVHGQSWLVSSSTNEVGLFRV